MASGPPAARARAAWPGRAPALRLRASVGLALAAAALAALSARAYGQGLRINPSKLGASGSYKNIAAVWSARQKQAQQLYASWKTRKGCAGGLGSLCGANPAAGGTARGEADEVLEILASPLAYDSRNPRDTGGVDLVNPPLDQGTCNACVGFALASAAETAIASALHVDARSLPRLSTRDLFFCHTKGAGKCDSGWTYDEALDNLLQRQVVADEKCMPWAGITKRRGDPCNAATQLCESSSVPRGEFRRDTVEQLDSHVKIMRFIRQHGSVLTAMRLYNGGAHLRNFFARNRTGVYSYDGAGAAPGDAVAHAVAVVGYDARAAPGFWIVKNSFGRDFADGGFFRLRFGEAGVMEPDFTFGITFEPAAAPIEYEGLGFLPGHGLKQGCLLYATDAGDYASSVAAKTGVELDALLLDNFKVFSGDPGAVLPQGTRLVVCNAKKGLRPVDAEILASMASLAPAGRQRGAAGPAPPAPPAPEAPAPPAAPPRPPPDPAGRGPAAGPADPAGGEKELLLAAAACCPALEWFPNRPHCSWRGVTCEGGKVTKIDLSANTLIGKLEPAKSWAGLTALNSIDLSGNMLSGVLPAAWSGITGLTTLDVHDNSLRSTLPAAWGPSLKLLETLDLSGNQLYGPIPDSYSKMASLRYLNLAGNSLAGELPPSLAALQALDTLNVSANQLSGALPALGPMPALVTLAVDSNGFSGKFPAALGGALPKLGALSVHGNRLLTGCLPAAWKGKVLLFDPESNSFVEEATRGALKGTALSGFCGG